MFQTKKSFKELMENFVEENGLKEEYYLMQIKESSEKIFQKNLNKQIKFIELSRGNLVLVAESSAWREELKLRRSEMVDKINSIIEKDIIKSIEVR